MKKILIIRFSSIGDIVLTTPVVRCIKQQIDGAEVHYLTKKSFAQILEPNPYISKIYTIEKHTNEVIGALRKEHYDFIVDLHRNTRSIRVLSTLKRPHKRFKKINLKKWLMVNFKMNQLPEKHIVDRYLEAAVPLGVKNDHEGLDYFIPGEAEAIAQSFLEAVGLKNKPYLGLVIGAAHATKRLPKEKIRSLVNQIDWPIIMLGGPGDQEVAEWVEKNSSALVINACGKFSLHQSAALVKHATKVITHDTGLMHIAAALNKSIISIWGNTIPEFGMYPYFPENPKPENFTIVQVEGLGCRPCSKIGFNTCPKGHFKCMEEIDEQQIINQLTNLML